MLHTVLFAAAAFVAGTVSPAIGRKLKAMYRTEVAAFKADVAKADAKLDAELKKVL
jgi:hypothetical protein